MGKKELSRRDFLYGTGLVTGALLFDFGKIIEKGSEFEDWFEGVEDIREVEMSGRFDGKRVVAGKVGKYLGRDRLLAIKFLGRRNFELNIPVVEDGVSEEIVTELIKMGYGRDIVVFMNGEKVEAEVFGKVVNAGNQGEIYEINKGEVDCRLLRDEFGRWSAFVVDEVGRYESFLPAVYETSSDLGFYRTNRTLERVNTSLGLRSVFLTMDDGKSMEQTTRVLDWLKRKGYKMTFYYNNLNLEGQERVIRRIIEEGHEIGYHTSDHRRENWSVSWLYNDVKELEQIISQAIGEEYKVRTARPPFGEWNYDWLQYCAHGQISTFMWDFDAIRKRNSSSVLEDALRQQSDSIVLTHDQKEDVDWLVLNEALLEEFVEEGYTFPTVTKGINQGFGEVSLVASLGLLRK